MTRKKSKAINTINKRKVFNALYNECCSSSCDIKFSQSGTIDEIDREKIDELYNDALIQQAVDYPVTDSIGNWIDTEGEKDNKLLLSLKDALIKAGISARKYGTGMVAPVIVGSNGKTVVFSKQFDQIEDAEILKFVEIERFEISDDLETNPIKQNYGKAKFYKIGNSKVDPSRAFLITSNNAKSSFLQSIEYYWTAFKSRYDDVTKAVEESNWIILKSDLKMLESIARAKSKSTNNMQNVDSIVSDLLTNRLQDLRLNANNNSAYGIDKEAEDVVVISKTNINHLIDSALQSIEFLSAACDQPLSQFTGKQVGGLGSRGYDPIYVQSLYRIRTYMFENSINSAIQMCEKLNGLTFGRWEWNKTVVEIMQEQA